MSKHLAAALVCLGFFGLIAWSEFVFRSMAPLWALLAFPGVIAVVTIVVEGRSPIPNKNKRNDEEQENN